MKKIVILATIVFFLLAPLTYHPDTKLTLRYAALENGRVWDIYKYLSVNKLDIPDFHYPPAHFWWLKIHYPISKLIGGTGFDSWLSSNSSEASFSQNDFHYNLAAKFPLLLLGLACGWLVYKIVLRETKEENKARLAAIIWYFNPVTIYSLVVMGQNDIVAIFLSLLAIWWYEKWLVAALCFGLAAGVKSYPIVWALMFWLSMEKNVTKFIYKSLTTLAVYGLILLPWITKPYFREAVLNSGLSQRMFIANIGIGFGKEILIVPLILMIFALTVFKPKPSIGKSSKVIFVSSLIILGFSHFNPQWLLWLSAFAAIWIASLGISKTEIMAFVAMILAWIVLTLGFDDKYLSWGLVTPISPSLINYPTLPELARNKNIDISNLINLAQTAIAGIALWFGFKKLRQIKRFKLGKIELNKWWIVASWVLVFLGILVVNLIKVDNKVAANVIDSRNRIAEVKNGTWNYSSTNGLRYLEFSLNNPGLVSTDKAKMVFRNENGDEFSKDFSGYNAGDTSWLRVDIPSTMANSKLITMSLKNVKTSDGQLSYNLDNQSRWAINFYYHGRPDFGALMVKMANFWWWWIMVLGISVYGIL